MTRILPAPRFLESVKSVVISSIEIIFGPPFEVAPEFPRLCALIFLGLRAGHSQQILGA